MIALSRFALSLAALAATISAAVANPVGQVVQLRGLAELQRGSESAQLLLGVAIEPGDTLRTGADARVRLQLIDGSTINLGSEAQFTIASVQSAGPGTERQIGLDLLLGALRAIAAPATQASRFEIRTPHAITAVRGTEWGIIASTIASDIIVLTGRVGVRKNEVSGVSATSLTRSLGVTVTKDGPGPITRWDDARLAAFTAATEVTGPSVDFDPGHAALLDLKPASSLGGEASGDESSETQRKAQKPCASGSGYDCSGGGDGKDDGSDSAPGDSDSSGSSSDSDSDGGSGY